MSRQRDDEHARRSYAIHERKFPGRLLTVDPPRDGRKMVRFGKTEEQERRELLASMKEMGLDGNKQIDNGEWPEARPGLCVGVFDFFFC